MQKFLATLGLLVVVALASLGFASSAQAVDYVDSGTESSGSPAAVSNSSGALPNTGGPETMLLVGGAALVAVGGTALVVSRRRANA